MSSNLGIMMKDQKGPSKFVYGSFTVSNLKATTEVLKMAKVGRILFS